MKKPNGEKPMITYTFRIELRQKEDIEALARYYKVKPSAIGRIALTNGIGLLMLHQKRDPAIENVPLPPLVLVEEVGE